MFGFMRSRVEERPSSEKRRRQRFTPGVESLERRDAPAALAMLSPGGVYATAKVGGGSTSSGTRLLANSNSGDIVSRSSGWTKAYTSLGNYSGASSYKTVEVVTSAYGRNTSGATQATAQTTQSNGTFQYVYARVQPTSGEQQGQSVRVTVKAAFVSTIGQFGRGYASNNFSFYVNGTKYLDRQDTSKGTETFRQTATVNTTIGSTVRFAFYMKSYAGASDSIGNTANMQLNLELSAERTGGGGGGGGGGQYGAPSAPNRPSWYGTGGSNIQLYWNDVAGETSYVIQYWKSSTSQWVTLATRGAGTTSIGINYGHGYYWRVGAMNWYGTSYSNYVLAK